MALFKSDNIGKSQTAKFPTPGSTVEGTIVRISEPIEKKKWRPAGSTKPEEVDTWNSGKPKMQVCITLDTGNRDPNDPDDDGTVGLWVLDDFSRPGNTLFPYSMLDAINTAVQQSGAEDLEIGGKLAVRFADLDPESKNADNPRKRYQARYTPAPRGGGMFSAPAEQPAEAPAAAPAPSGGFGDAGAPQAHTAHAPAPQADPAPMPESEWEQAQISQAADAEAGQAKADGFGLSPDTIKTIDVMLANGIGTDVIVNATGVPAEQIDARRF